MKLDFDHIVSENFAFIEFDFLLEKVLIPKRFILNEDYLENGERVVEVQDEYTNQEGLIIYEHDKSENKNHTC